MPHRPDDAPAYPASSSGSSTDRTSTSRAPPRRSCSTSTALLDLPRADLRARAAARASGSPATGGPGTEVRARVLARLLVGTTRRLAATAGVDPPRACAAAPGRSRAR